MADRRMIHRKVMESDTFYELPESAQALYAHLTINADDDGFCNCAGSIASRIKGGRAALQRLVEDRYLLRFGNIYVVKHWRIGNSLKNDRAKLPTYPSIAAQIWVKDNRAYTDHPVEGCRTLLEIKTGVRSESDRNPLGIHLESQRNRTEQNRTEQNRTEPAEGAFQRLWEAYPEEKRGSRQAAMEAASLELHGEDDVAVAIKSLDAWKRSEQWTKEGGRFIPYLRNWLERGCWRVSPDEPVKSGDRELDEEEREAIRRLMEEP